MPDSLKITVFGCGVVGITTALELQKEFRKATIKIIADKFNEQTTSSVAPGIFGIGPTFHGPTEEITKKWVQSSYDFWNDLIGTEEGKNAGVTEVTGHALFSSETSREIDTPLLKKILPKYRKALIKDRTLYPGSWKYGYCYTTPLTQCSEYLPWAMMKFHDNEGKLEHKTVNSFGDVIVDCDILVNCTSNGALKLCNDKSIANVRGQVLTVKTPLIDKFLIADSDTYIIPGIDVVTLGGSKQFDQHNLLSLCKYDEAATWKRCCDLIKGLEDNCEQISTRVGLCCYRNPVRVEKEVINGLKIVHNYGHGFYGVATAPGTAQHAVALVKELHTGQRSCNCKDYV